jgi:hypothetical protein
MLGFFRSQRTYTMVIEGRAIRLRFGAAAPIQYLCPVPIFKAVLWEHPLRRLECRTADHKVDSARQDLVGAVRSDDFEWAIGALPEAR